jgi:S1-C subfamily serine protease
MKQTAIDSKKPDASSVQTCRVTRLLRTAGVFAALFVLSTAPAMNVRGQETEPPTGIATQLVLPDENSIAVIQHGINAYEQYIGRSLVRVNLDSDPVHVLPKAMQPAFWAWENQWTQQHNPPATSASSGSAKILIMPDVISGPGPTPQPPPSIVQQQWSGPIQNNPRRELLLVRLFLVQNHAATRPDLWPVLRGVNQLVTAWQNGFPSSTTGLVVANQGRILVLSTVGIPNDGSPVQLTTQDGKGLTASVVGQNDQLDMTVLQLPKNADLAGIEPTQSMRNGPMYIAVDAAAGNIRFLTPSDIRNRLHPAVFLAPDAVRTSQFILNMHGELVAVMTTNHTAIGAATWSDLVDFINTGKVEQRRFGVKYVSIVPNSSLRRVYSALGTQPAVLVQSIVPHSPADLGGIQTNDIIVKIDGISIAQLQTWLNRAHDNPENVQISVLRQGKPMTLSLDLTLRYKSAGKVNQPAQ